LQHLLELAPSFALHSVSGSSASRLSRRFSQFADVASNVGDGLCLSVARKSSACSTFKRDDANLRTNSVAGELRFTLFSENTNAFIT
jgi:hypothetical protein